MDKKVLIGYDGSDWAEAALDDLVFAGLPREVDAMAVSVKETWLPLPPPSSYEIVEQAMAPTTSDSPVCVEEVEAQPEEEMMPMALRAKERLERNFPGWRVTAQSSYGSPSSEIIRIADECEPDLIVLGSRGRSATARLMLGSVSQKVLTEARCSVRVGRGRIEVEEPAIRLLIGVDGSAGAAEAVRAVVERSWPRGTEARVVIVDEPLTMTSIGQLLPPVRKWVQEVNREDRNWMEQIIEIAADKLEEAGLIVSSEIGEGDPKRALVEIAEEWRASSIFLGSTGLSNRFERFMLGSISASVAARAHCSVEVVRERRDS
jgi:nucleotide-binding universal stress UspA family protein